MAGGTGIPLTDSKRRFMHAPATGTGTFLHPFAKNQPCRSPGLKPLSRGAGKLERKAAGAGLRNFRKLLGLPRFSRQRCLTAVCGQAVFCR